MRSAAIFVMGMACRMALAQDTFEAATIRPFPEGAPLRMSGCEPDPGRINCEHVDLRSLLMQAYKVKSQEIFGPAWLDSEHLNIVAKLPGDAKPDQIPAMLRALLEDRFKLALHHEQRPVAV